MAARPRYSTRLENQRAIASWVTSSTSWRSRFLGLPLGSLRSRSLEYRRRAGYNATRASTASLVGLAPIDTDNAKARRTISRGRVFSAPKIENLLPSVVDAGARSVGCDADC